MINVFAKGKKISQAPHLLLSIAHVITVAVLAMAVFEGEAFAATIEVTSTSDTSTECTLREAVASVNEGSATNSCINSSGDDFGVNDSIVFSPQLDGPITLESGPLVINSSSPVTIDASSFNDGVTLIGDPQSRVLTMSGSQLQINNMTITGGSGGISVFSSILILNNSVVSDNAIIGNTNGGGIFATSASTVILNNSKVVGNLAFNGGGIFAISSSTITLNNSSISDNTASNSGGGVLLTNLTTANNPTIANLNNSTVSGNIAEGFSSGGISVGTLSELNLNNSTVFGNSTNGEGGGISAGGGTATVNLNNSTVSGNSANTDGGGIRSRTANVNLINSTVAGNSAEAGGGIFVTNGVTNLTNSIIANSLSGNDCSNFPAAGSVIADSTNIIEDGSCTNTSAMTVNPMLLPLADNGGATLTHALRSRSPAINAGDQSVCNAVPINNLDQRGEGRLVGGSCDIGAYEYQKEVGNIIPSILSILLAENTVTESNALVYANDFSSNSLEGLTVTEEGSANIIVENGELRINPGPSFRDRGVVAVDLEAENSEYMSRLADNNGILIYSFNIRNMDANLNNSYTVGIWSSEDTSDPESFGYQLSGGGFVGNQFRFIATALARSKFGPVLDDIIIFSDGLQPATQVGAFRIEFTPATNLWELYFEASTKVLDPLSITQLVGSGINDRFTSEELKYLTLTGQTTGVAYFDNINISIRAN